LAAVQHKAPDVVVIIVSGQMGEEVAIDCLKRGAVDYVLKTNLQRLPAAVRHAAREWARKLALRQAEGTLRGAQAELEQRVKDRTADLRLANSGLNEEIASHSRTEKELQDSRTLISSVFASMFGNVAVLDRAGVIIAVNHAWLRFAAENGGQVQHLGTGVNYLDVAAGQIKPATRRWDPCWTAWRRSWKAPRRSFLPNIRVTLRGNRGGAAWS